MAPINDIDDFCKTCTDESYPNADLYQQDLPSSLGARLASPNTELADHAVEDPTAAEARETERTLVEHLLDMRNRLFYRATSKFTGNDALVLPDPWLPGPEDGPVAQLTRHTALLHGYLLQEKIMRSLLGDRINLLEIRSERIPVPAIYREMKDVRLQIKTRDSALATVMETVLARMMEELLKDMGRQDRANPVAIAAVAENLLDYLERDDAFRYVESRND